MSIFEALMLICFGISWPIAIAKSLRAKRVDGKSPLFMGLIVIGYVSGIINKIVNTKPDGSVDWVVWLYALNFVMVSFDLYLYFYYTAKNKRAA